MQGCIKITTHIQEVAVEQVRKSERTNCGCLAFYGEAETRFCYMIERTKFISRYKKTHAHVNMYTNTNPEFLNEEKRSITTPPQQRKVKIKRKTVI